ncbi:PTS sugar transporter subunit IIA [Paramaledivibacter caminithermalis]|jgi:fructose-specific phosphotransferase system IIA component|uniref:PTS system IIA component, Fru family n=1 Tax=Paramaledivibacter caminithermalis (strain DSM 15212 / CIP 107654 / DViRD3) TaxID=1121301 RepID=A0A1M6K9R7_PARC5|nr:fructose PTS transporter subunit IIA [Paramaledivibacter caminithermalis]SHJ55685.1 PTS system IIA component, Fru family [Paramaledivibacter caminithermalis DSM 15212]
MMEKIIDINLIDLNLNCLNKEDAIISMANLLEKCGRLNNKEEYINEVIRREKLSSTGIGFGIGIPHGKSNAVKVPSLVFGRTKQGIEWQSLDGKPVNIIFLIAVPEKASNQHLKILASLSRKLMNQEFRKQLSEITNKKKLIEMLNGLIY